jgi:hypothetical protein
MKAIIPVVAIVAASFMTFTSQAQVSEPQARKKVEKDTVSTALKGFLKKAKKETSIDIVSSKKLSGYQVISLYYDPKKAILVPAKNGLLIYTR